MLILERSKMDGRKSNTAASKTSLQNEDERKRGKGNWMIHQRAVSDAFEVEQLWQGRKGRGR
jgi:hypothetical protein